MILEIKEESSIEKPYREQLIDKLMKLYPDAVVDGTTVKIEIKEKQCRFCGRPFVSKKPQILFCNHKFKNQRCQQMNQYFQYQYSLFDYESTNYKRFLSQGKKNLKKMDADTYDEWVLLCYKANYYYDNNVLPKKQFEEIIKSDNIKLSAELINIAKNLYNHNQRLKKEQLKK